MKYFLILILVAALAAGGYAAWMWYSITQPYQGFPNEGVFVELPHGASPRYAAYLLNRSGVVRSKLAFEIYARRHPKRTLQAGEYFFDHPMTGRDVFWKIAVGQIFQQPFTVREGETMFDVARELEAGKFMPAGDFLYAASDPSLIRDFSPEARTLEGFLFPATYELPRHPVATELTAQMVHKFKDEWKRIEASNPGSETAPNGQAEAKAANSPKEPTSLNMESPTARLRTVTLASLVERETPKPEERPMVASVFDNRIEKRMRLQCDPTVIYGLERMGKYKGSLTKEDLIFDSPYNTYEHYGLPPGPIGNPGEASLRAALHPAETSFLYFVANTQGGHFFSFTLAEHNRNVLKYHRLLAGLPADPPPPPPKPQPAKKKQTKPTATKGKQQKGQKGKVDEPSSQKQKSAHPGNRARD